MGEVSNCLSTSWQMRSDVPPPLTPLSFSRMKRKDHTSKVSWPALLMLGSVLSHIGQTGRQWFWVLWPKPKALGCRAETRQYQKSLRHCS